ncbi:MAG: GTPase RsgA [Rhodothermales bacterium]
MRESDDRGRHTTTRRHLTPLPGGALIIDTSGMREFGLLGSDDGFGASFADIDALAADCRFSDCRHESESGCAVLAAVAAGELDDNRLRSWHKLEREAYRHEMSIAEKRRKDRDQGKLYKRIMAQKRDRR